MDQRECDRYNIDQMVSSGSRCMAIAQIRALLLIEQTLHDGLVSIVEMIRDHEQHRPIYHVTPEDRQPLPIREISPADLPPLVAKIREIDTRDKGRTDGSDH